MGNLEARVQAQIVAWAREAAPHAVVFAVPNDGWYSKSEAAKRKWVGVLAGVPDLCIIDRGGRALFLEVKQGKGQPSEAQVAVIAKLEGLQARAAVVTSMEEAQRALTAWGVVEVDAAETNGPTGL